MALVQYGGGVLNMSGSIGGQTHSHNRSGTYVRRRATPVNPATNRQEIVRAAVSFLSTRWSEILTAVQRAAWEVYADAITRTNALGAQIKLTGFNHYIRSNTPRKQIGAPIVDDGPINLTIPGADPTMFTVIDETNQEITLNFDNALPWSTQTGGYIICAMSSPKGQAVNFIGGPFRIAGQVVGIDPGGAVTPAQLDVPFPVGETQQIKVQCRISEEDGRLSDLFQFQIAAVA